MGYQDYITVQGKAMSANGVQTPQPVTKEGEVCYCNIVTPGGTGPTSLTVFHKGTPACFRQAWMSDAPNGQIIPGGVMINPATGKPFDPGATDGVFQGMDPVNVQVWIGEEPPQNLGPFHAPPVWLLPSHLYRLHFINLYDRFGQRYWPTTSAYTSFAPISGA